MRPRGIAIASALVAVLGLFRAVSTPPWPDDWDGIGFVESIKRFDLDHFVPHPPGYPVYVALLRAAGRLVDDPIVAANAVAVASGLACTVLVALAAARALRSWQRGVWIAAYTAVVPLAWRAGTAIGSEGPALACVCAALAGATMAERRPGWWIGVAVGLGLGVRLSWAPLFLALLVLAPRGARLRATVVAVGATLAWAVPFVAVVGPAHLVRLAAGHASGHFHTWGGTALSEPGPMRLAYLARDVFVDGIGVDRDPLGIAIGVIGLALVLIGLRAWHARGWPHARSVVVLLAPYLVWIALGQNLRQQPRHALPIAMALAGALALAAASSLRARVLGGALLSLVMMRTATDAVARETTPPAGAQLVGLVRGLPGPPNVAVFAGPSARFFELLESNAIAQTVGTLGDARLAVGRMRSLPARVVVTSELQGLDASRDELVPLGRLCRPERVDRRAPCLDAYEWRSPSLTPR